MWGKNRTGAFRAGVSPYNTFRGGVRAAALLSGCAAALLMAVPPVHASGFEEFRDERRQAFDTFREEFDEAFRQYKETFEAELEAYRDELRSHWRDPVVSDNTHWVEYTEDRTGRTTVDYETNEVRVEVPAEAGREGAIDQLASVLNRTLDEAYGNDEVTQRTEERLGRSARDLGAEGGRRVLSEVSPDDAPEMLARARTEERREAAPDGRERDVTVLTVPLPETRASDKAREYLPLVEEQAAANGVDEALMLAVMHAESYFNPMARSHIPAYGLMQIVPGSAGKDVSQVLYGEPQLLSPDYLYNPANNIRAGATYLSILDERYLRRIEDPESRLYAVISAYNTGAGNVARTFTGGSTNVGEAAEIINGMAPDAVFRTLREQLPYQETREYLVKVAQYLSAYRDL